ncbi:MAG TPA: DUF2726 domain-containing protein, partial [Thermaerobacter sp.]
SLPFRRVDSLLTPAERQFFEVLQQAVAGRHLILAKVRLADLFHIEAQGKDWWRAFGRVSNKHVDFVLVDRFTWAPELVIELDDSSHRRPRRRQRDALVNRICEAGGLPLLRVSVRRRWNARELAEEVESRLGVLEAASATGGDMATD